MSTTKKGRPVKYGEPMKMISVRVPISKIPEVMRVIKETIKKAEGT